MKRFWARSLMVVICVIALGGFVSPRSASASVSNEEVANMISAGHAVFDLISTDYGNTYETMVRSVAGRLKDDPDVNVYQLRRYVLEGIPGATDRNQTGFIPMLSSIAASCGSFESVCSRSKTALAQAEQLLKNSATLEQKAAGVLTDKEASAKMNNAAQDSVAGTSAALNDPTGKTARGEPDSKCSVGLWSEMNLGACIDEGFTWLIKNTLLQLGGFLVWLTANMLNYAIQISILDFSKWASSSLYPIWLVIRQIVSLFVVFAGLYLGFMYIIGRTETFGKFFGWLVIFALFVNFSYPFSRALVDVSNIISLNVYSAAVGPNALTTNFSSSATTLGANTAGAQIMNKLGLYGLVGSATAIASEKGDGFVNKINSTPGALLAVAFVFYAAYIFFMATAIIAVRTAVLVFLTVASPLLLVDSVVPKLGDAAVKMRKMFFEQLAIAPVFMIMLALTLKFMEVFRAGGGPLDSGSVGRLTGGGVDSVQTFFSILMMLIMLHIMIKVTKSLAGEAGQAATNFMGKVGGFGLGVATGGAGILARGTIGAGAARLRDSAWMDKVKSSSVGRGMYGLTNSLAQSTYDVRNVGMVSSGMAKAGLTGGLGMTMQKGIKQGFDERKKSRTEEVVKFGSNIRDDEARAAYFNRANTGRLVRVDAAQPRQTERDLQEKRKAAILAYEKASPADRQAQLDNVGNDYVLREKLRAADQYLAPNVMDNEREPDAMKKKVDALVKLNDSDLVKNMIDSDPFNDIQNAYKKEIEQQEDELETYSKAKEVTVTGADGVERKMTEYEQKRQELAKKKQDVKKEIESKKKELFDEYQKRIGATPVQSVDLELPEDTFGGTKVETQRPGGSDTSRFNTQQYATPASQRATDANFPPKPVPVGLSASGNISPSDTATTTPLQMGAAEIAANNGDTNTVVERPVNMHEQTLADRRKARQAQKAIGGNFGTTVPA